MTEAEKMLKSLGFEFSEAKDFGFNAYCNYRKDDCITVSFSKFKSEDEWDACVQSFEPDYDEYYCPHHFDVRLARAIVKRLEELNV